MTTTTQHQERVLCDKEDELVCLLSGKDPMEIAHNLYKRNVLSNTMWDLFTSLDHSNLDPQLQIKYLLRLVCKIHEEDRCVWVKFLNLLSDMGGDFNTMRKKLEEELDKVSREPDIILVRSDAEGLTESLAEISYKWEEVGVALKLPKHVIEKCRCRDKDIISLSDTITSWLSGENNTPTNTTLHTLKKALCGPIVAEPNIAEEAGKRFLPVESPRLSLSPVGPTDSHMTIINQSGNTVVAEGRSTLLLVQTRHRESASYQWKKDGCVLVNSSTYLGVCEEILVIHRARQGIEGKYTCNVSSEGRQASSNKIIVTLETRTFINLTLIKSTNGPIEREKVEYEQVFRECKSGEQILLEGRPGSGKTTLVHKIIKDWTKGSILENARWVILIPLRELNNIRAESLSDLVGYFSQNDKAIINSIEKDAGEGLCFIIDGLNEYQPPDKTKSPIYQLLNKVIIPKSIIIVSSCPSAIKNFDWKELPNQIEILGFNRKYLFQYIDNFPFSCDSDITTNAMYATQLKKYLRSNPNVFNMCYLPVHAAMICFLFKCKRKIPFTQTKMYEQFTICIILRHLKRSNSKQQLESLQDLSETSKTHFKKLCRLAYEMTINSKQVVIPQEMNVQLSDSSVAEDTRYLGLVNISHKAKLGRFHSTYTFLHLTFQEFLAAVHISSLSEEDQLTLIKEYNNHNLTSMWGFYFGLVKFRHKDKRMCELFKSIHGINLLECAFESQQQTVCDVIMARQLGHLRCFSNVTPQRILALCYVLSSSSRPITKVTCTNHNKYVVTKLLQGLKKNTVKLNHLQELKIHHVSGYAQMLLLKDILSFTSDLKECDLYLEGTGGVGMRYIADAFMSLLHLQKLRIHVKNISNGVKQLFKGLQYLPSTQLSLHFKCKRNEVMGISAGLQQLTINRVRKLELCDGSVGVDGALALGNSLLNFKTLCILYLPNNKIGDEEVKYLSFGIKSLSNLHWLDLSRNNIGPSGASILAGTIVGLGNLRSLELQHNNIDSQGTTALAGAIKHLNFTSLNLSSNNIGCEGAAALASAIQHLNFKCLDLSNNRLDSESAVTLTSAIQHHKCLNYFSLSGNNLGLIDALLLIDTLKKHLCRTVCINVDKNHDKYGGFQVQGLVFPGDNISIAALKAAIQHDKYDRELELGFNKIKVPSKCHESLVS